MSSTVTSPHRAGTSLLHAFPGPFAPRELFGSHRDAGAGISHPVLCSSRHRGWRQAWWHSLCQGSRAASLPDTALLMPGGVPVPCRLLCGAPATRRNPSTMEWRGNHAPVCWEALKVGNPGRVRRKDSASGRGIQNCLCIQLEGKQPRPSHLPESMVQSPAAPGL